MSNKNSPPSEEMKTVRWRMRLPARIADHILDLAYVEERDPGAIAARLVIEQHKIMTSTIREAKSG